MESPISDCGATTPQQSRAGPSLQGSTPWRWAGRWVGVRQASEEEPLREEGEGRGVGGNGCCATGDADDAGGAGASRCGRKLVRSQVVLRLVMLRCCCCSWRTRGTAGSS